MNLHSSLISKSLKKKKLSDLKIQEKKEKKTNIHFSTHSTGSGR